MKISATLLWVLLLSLFRVDGSAPAQEFPEGATQSVNAEPPLREPAWNASLEMNLLPAARTGQGGGEVAAHELKTEVTRHYRIASRFQLSSGLRYALTRLDAPAELSLPDSLHSLSLALGAHFATDRQWLFGLHLSPGASGDFRGGALREVRVPVAAFARYQAGPALAVTAGVAYTGQEHLLPVVPLLGVLYLPSERWSLALGFPQTGIRYRGAGGVAYFWGAEFSGGEYRLHDASAGAKVVAYRDLRSVAGAELPLSRGTVLALSAGYAGGRRFDFYEGERALLRPGAVPFGRAELRYAW